jgi:hypothetical protein
MPIALTRLSTERVEMPWMPETGGPRRAQEGGARMRQPIVSAAWSRPMIWTLPMCAVRAPLAQPGHATATLAACAALLRWRQRRWLYPGTGGPCRFFPLQLDVMPVIAASVVWRTERASACCTDG